MPSREGAPDAFYLFNSHFFNFQFTPHMVTPSGFATCCLKGFLHTAHGTGFRLACLQTKQLLIVLPGVLPSREGVWDAGYPSKEGVWEESILSKGRGARRGQRLTQKPPNSSIAKNKKPPKIFQVVFAIP